MLPLVLATLLGLAALIVVLGPLFTASAHAQASDAAATTLAERERAAKAALQDVEFDYQLGNLAEDDYRGLRERYVRRALAALKGRYDREKALDDAIEAQVRALREQDAERDGNGHRATHSDDEASNNSQNNTTRRAQANGSAGSAPRSNPPNRPNSRSNKRGGPGKHRRRPT